MIDLCDALAGGASAVLAVAVLAPQRPAPIVSFAPPPPPIEEPPPSAAVDWPDAFDRRAAGCDAAARLLLAGALDAVRAPWADRLLERALLEEPDPAVRAAIARAVTQRP